jgi:spermidine synthase
VLFLLALTLSVFEQKRMGRTRAILPCMLLAVAGAAMLPQVIGAGHVYTGGDRFQVRFERESLYGWVRVVDEPGRDLRLLMSDASAIGAARISDGINQLTYQEIAKLIPALMPGINRALLLGQGAGHMAMTLRDRYGIVTDTLEIDPAVAEAAAEYFGFTPTGETRIGDARYEVRRLQGPYDLVILDCFTGGSEPAHLLTVEALSQLRALMSDRAILALNFVALTDKGHDAALASVARTLAQVFEHHQAFASEPGRDLNDFIFLASFRPLDLDSPALDRGQAAWLKSRLIEVDASEGVPLTDNLNPLEHLQVRKAEHYRGLQIEWFGSDLLSP